MADLRLDGRVAIVTGAGGGLGRSHALLLASRGAKVVVNDLGGGIDGTGKSTSMADRVVEEIKATGGEAVANHSSVATPEDAKAIVQTALDAFGKVDIVVNNAGILRDKSFHKMEDSDWQLVIDVHLNGTGHVTRAAWPHLRENNWGRVIFTTSSAGLWGNFGQANYSAAKLGMVGLMNTLKLEGAKYGILCNTIAPFAGTRLMATVLPPQMLEALKPEAVSPLVGFLASDECQVTGQVFVCGAGHFACAQIVESEGVNLDSPTPESVRDHLAQIMDMSKAKNFAGGAGEAGGKVFAAVKM